MTSGNMFIIEEALFQFKKGYLVNNRFEIISKPVQRNFGVVYITFDKKSRKRKLLHFIPRIMQTDPEAMEAIRQEVELIRFLKHPNIARLYDLHQMPGLAFLEMDYAQGKSMRAKKLDRPRKRFSENIAIWTGLEILEALEYAHDQNVLHRDIKPQNVIITVNGGVQLIDAGISEVLRSAMNLVQNVSQATSILYMSPEQVQGERLSVQSDLYSVAATIYDLVSGKPPFHLGDVYTQILRKEPQPLEHVSAPLNDILMKGLRKEPGDRYGSASAMRAALLRATSYHAFRRPVSRGPEAPREVKPKVARRAKPARPLAQMFKNPAIKYMVLSIFVIIIMMLFASQWLKTRTSVEQLQQAAPGTSVADTFNARLRDALGAEAEKKYQQGVWIDRTGQNALELFREVLKIDPDNELATSRIDTIRLYILSLARILHVKNRDSAGEKLLALGSTKFPGDTLFSLPPARLPRLPLLVRFPDNLKIEVLNGTGISGVASRVAQRLGHFTVPTWATDNYRKRGRIDWKLAQSTFYGQMEMNIYVKLISDITGLPYQRQAAFQAVTPGSNAAIALGRDYATLDIY